MTEAEWQAMTPAARAEIQNSVNLIYESGHVRPVMTDSERAIEEHAGDYTPLDLQKENL